MNCEEAKRIPIIGFLEKNNHHPKKIVGNDYWFLSPFRNEDEPSFKVSNILNLWFDHGLGKGGTLVDLACLIYRCSVKEALEKLSNGTSWENTPIKRILHQEANSIKVVNVKDIEDMVLIRYMHSRRIDIDFARKFSKEVQYKTEESQYIFRAIGLPTITNGWELHTPTREGSFKNSTTPKSISHFKFGKDEVAVFEGQYDFYSIWTYNKSLAQSCDFIILNSLSLKGYAIDLLIEYSKIHLFLDNDSAGKSATAFFLNLEITQGKTINHSQAYGQSKDLNDHIRGISFDKTQKISPNTPPDIKKPNRGLSL